MAEGKRRLLLAPALAEQSVLLDPNLDHALELLDQVEPGSELIAGPYGVFSLSPPSSALAQELGNHEQLSEYPDIDEAEQSWSSPATVSFHGLQLVHTPDVGGSVFARIVSSTHNSKTLSPQYRHLADSEDQHTLLECWVSRLSDLMTPIPCRDNIFTNIITPLALQALTEHQNSYAHLALLHAVLAMTAFWRENISEDTGRGFGGKYLDSSLSLLTRCMEDPQYPQAILATICILLFIPAFSAENSVWRVHIRGGIVWLQSVDTSVWKQDESSVVLLQLFGVCEALSPAASWVGISNASSPALTSELDLGCDAHWRLDKVFGITKAITETIRDINVFLYSTTPTRQELDELELKIYRSDPTNMSFPDLDSDCEKLAQQHVRLYYYAAHLYFSRCLKHATVSKIQHFVRSSLRLVRRIQALEERHEKSGILWPFFVIACEATDTESRLSLMRYLGHREAQGIANTAAARGVVLKVWSERDVFIDSDLSWVDTIRREKIDILLL